MSRPQGYRQALAELCFRVLVVCLPYWSPFLLATISGAVGSILIAVLLMFVVEYSSDLTGTVAACIESLQFIVRYALAASSGEWRLVLSCILPAEPSLRTPFQRPPPIFS